MSELKNILSIDQSFTCSGVCVLSPDGRLLHYECIKTTKDKSNPRRMLTISDRLLKLYDDYACTHVVCEGLAFGSFGDATRNLAGLMGVIETRFLERYGVAEITKLSPTGLKKFATGSGKAKKKDMMDALPKELYDSFYESGYKRTTGLADLADAYFIGKMYIATVVDKERKLDELGDI